MVCSYLFVFVCVVVVGLFLDRTHAEFASAVLLVVESILLYYGYAPLAQATFAPVLVQRDDAKVVVITLKPLACANSAVSRSRVLKQSMQREPLSGSFSKPFIWFSQCSWL